MQVRKELNVTSGMMLDPTSQISLTLNDRSRFIEPAGTIRVRVVTASGFNSSEIYIVNFLLIDKVIYT